LRASFILLLSFLIAACSWSHKPLQPLQRETADRDLRAAGKQLSHDPARASELYSAALQKYRDMADIEGEMWSLSGIASSSLASGDSLAYLETRAGMDAIVRDIDPELDYIPLLLDLQTASDQRDWQRVSSLAADKDSWPAPARLRVLAYAIQADSYLGLDRSARVKLALKLLRGQKRKLHRQGSDHALQIARVRYALAYHYLAENNYRQTHKQLAQAIELDRLYGDFDALGYDYWLLAKLNIAEARPAVAKASFMKAQRLFEGSVNSAMLTRVETELKSLDTGE